MSDRAVGLVTSDRLVGIVILLLVPLAWFAMADVPDQSGMMPKGVLGFIALAAVILVVKGGRVATDGDHDATSLLRIRPGATMLTSLAYVLLIQPLGYFIATPLFLVVLVYLLGERRPLVHVVVVSLSCLIVYVVFERLFFVPLPAGLLASIRG